MDPNKKKELRNAYKEKPAVGGVYSIRCSGNQRVLIKSAIDLESIKNRFQFSLITKGCPDPTLQKEWQEFGTESFSLCVLEELKKKETQTEEEFADDIETLYEMWLEKNES